MTKMVDMITISVADAAARLSGILDEIRGTRERVVITRDGQPEAFILTVSDLESLEETVDVLSTPGALEELMQAKADLAAGNVITEGEMRRMMEERIRRESVE